MLGCEESPPITRHAGVSFGELWRNGWSASIRVCTRRRSVRCMRCSTATAWSSAEGGGLNRAKRTALSLPGCDFASRYIFACEAFSTTEAAYAFPVFEAVFREFGLPKAVGTDNGVRFAGANALFGRSKLSV